MGLMTHSKAKSTTTLLAKLASKYTHLLKTTRMHDSYQLIIILAYLGIKSQSLHSREKHISTLKDSGNKSPYSVVDANFNTDSHFRSPIEI